MFALIFTEANECCICVEAESKNKSTKAAQDRKTSNPRSKKNSPDKHGVFT